MYLITNTDTIQNVNVQQNLTFHLSSDHFIVSFYIVNCILRLNREPRFMYIWLFYKLVWTYSFSNIIFFNPVWLPKMPIMYGVISNSYAINHATEMFVPSKSRQQPPLIYHRIHSFWRAYCSTPSLANMIKLEEAKNKIQHLLKEAKALYEITLVQKYSYSNNSKNF